MAFLISLLLLYVVDVLLAEHTEPTSLNLRVLIDGNEWSLPEGPELVYQYKKDAAG